MEEGYLETYESVRDLVLDMSRERTVDGLLKLIVERLAQRPAVALVCIWAKRPGDVCDTCLQRAVCPDQTECLHLVAHGGRSLTGDQEGYARIARQLRRVPIGVGEVGRIASTGQGLDLPVREDGDWIVDREWVEAEDINFFGGQPLMFGDEVLGVLAGFARIPEIRGSLEWVRMIADHAAAAIANSRAFEEIQRLKHQLELENEYLRAEVLEAQSFGGLVGKSAALRHVVEQVELVAPSDANVLILGESGTGKELVAREIHERSRRSAHALVRVNCASVPRELYESEFFGHVKGAFTGAVKDRRGRFELADGGTLFLDEVGEIPLELQGKLLRVLQEGQYERVGDETTRQVDVRILAATNRDLKKEVAAGRFREDLFYRLNVFPIEIAPLRQRREDIPLLAAHFLELAARRLHCAPPTLTEGAVLKLQAYDWPGNVRELQNVIERAVITSRSGTLLVEIPGESSEEPAAPRLDGEEGAVIPEDEMRRRERENVRHALERTGWKIYGPGGAAELLGIRPTTLASRIKKMGLERPRPV